MLRLEMDSDDRSLRASSGAHSSRSQLIVVSPRPASETENEGENGAEEEVGITFSNPMLKDNGQVVVSVEVNDDDDEEDSPPVVRIRGRPTSTPANRSSQLPVNQPGVVNVRPTTTPAALQLSRERTDGYQSLEEDGEAPMSPIHQEIVEEVLYNRPTLRLGREMSMRFRARTAIPSRRRRIYHSLPHGAKRPKTTTAASSDKGEVRLRRVSSLPNVNDEDTSAITLEDLHDIMDVQTPSTLRREEDLRRSTRRLKERIQLHHFEEQRRSKVAHESIFANFYYVKWPKIKSRLRVAASYRLWNGHMKEVEGHFGSAVVSYFVYLRWLFIMNLVIFAFWFGLVVIPNAIYISVADPSLSPSLLSCYYPFSSNSTISCSNDNSTFDSDNLFYLLSGGTPQYTCTAPSNGTSFSLRMCETTPSTLNGFPRDIATKESSSSPLAVSSLMPILSECTLNEGGSGSVVIEEVRLCSSDIAPYIPWFQYLIDFVQGQGVFNETVLFYGRYGNGTIGGYNLPVAFLFVTGIVYTISVALLVYKMGHAYNESYVEVGKTKSINFCNKLFTAWDFNITDPDTAKLRRVQIRTDLEEEIADYERRNEKRSRKELAIVVLIRIFTNLLTLIVLLGGAVTIFYSTSFGLQNQSSSGISFEGLVTPVVITTLNLILPFLFSFLARFERFKTQSGEIKMTLLRAIFVRLASLIVLIATIYILIRCTQEVSEETSSATSGMTVCSFTGLDLNSFIGGNDNDTDGDTLTDTEECPVCWETFIGQEFYKLGLTNFAVSAVSTIAVETFRNIVSRVKYKGLGQKIGKGNFNIPKSILDLIYTQSLLWLGFFFSPMLPAVILITSFVLFYIKKYSLIYNLEPDKRGATKTARNNFLYLFLMLATLGFFLIPVGVAIGSFRPSESCGPFRGNPSFFSAISDWVNTFSCVTQQVLDYFATASFVIPLIALLLLVVYGQYVLLRSRKAKFELIKKQLILEGANVTHIVGKLDNVLQKVADHRQEVMTNVVLVSPPAGHTQHSPSPSANYQRQRSSLDVSGQYTGSIATGHPTPLKERIQQMRLSISEQENQLLSSQVSVNERDTQRSSRSSLPSMAESSGEHLPSTKTVESSM